MITIKRSDAHKYQCRYNDDGEEEFFINGQWVNTYDINWID